MGDFADMAIADALAMDDGTYGDWDDADSWGHGGGWLGPRYRPPRPKTCNSCGKTPLYWQETDHGWRLHDCVGVSHYCNYKQTIGKPKDDYNSYLDTIPWNLEEQHWRV